MFESGLGAFELTRLIEEELERAFGEKIPSLVKTSTEMIEIAETVKRTAGSSYISPPTCPSDRVQSGREPTLELHSIHYCGYA